MKLYVVSAVFVALGLAGALAIQSSGLSDGEADKSGFGRACSESLHSAVDWAVAEAERSGKTVAGALRAVATFKISPVCGCAREALGAKVSEEQLVVMGKLVGLRFRTELALKSADPELKATAKASAREEVSSLMADHDVTLAELSRMSSQIDSVMNGCFRKHLPKW
jgi:hypothetical protein